MRVHGHFDLLDHLFGVVGAGRGVGVTTRALDGLHGRFTNLTLRPCPVIVGVSGAAFILSNFIGLLADALVGFIIWRKPGIEHLVLISGPPGIDVSLQHGRVRGRVLMGAGRDIGFADIWGGWSDLEFITLS